MKKYTKYCKNEHRTNTATSPTAQSFLFVERGETSSKGPGCLYIDMKSTRIAIGQKSATINIRIDRNVKAIRALSPRIERATCPPSSIAAGSKFNIVTIMPTQPAKATG